MTSFLKRVKGHLLNRGWNIQYSNIPYISFFAVQRGRKVKKAYHVKAHGHLLHIEKNALEQYSQATGVHVIYVHEAAGRQLEFIHLYPRKQKRNYRKDGITALAIAIAVFSFLGIVAVAGLIACEDPEDHDIFLEHDFPFPVILVPKSGGKGGRNE